MVEAPTEGKQSPVRMARAKEWDETVENAYRLQEAGYRDLAEARSLGHPEPELWPQTGLIRKLTTKESMRKEVCDPSRACASSRCTVLTWDPIHWRVIPSTGV